MTGREFEDLIVKKLHENGYWAHRISPNEAGQQPFDVICMKGKRVCAYDAKVVSDGFRFPMKRIEDNQYNAFTLFAKKTAADEIGLLIYCEEDQSIHYMSMAGINTNVWLGNKSVDIRELPLWRIV